MVVAEVTPTMQPGHISLPNGQGLEYRDPEDRIVRAGVAPNELTDVAMRDSWPAHRGTSACARLERCDLPEAQSA